MINFTRIADDCLSLLLRRDFAIKIDVRRKVFDKAELIVQRDFQRGRSFCRGVNIPKDFLSWTVSSDVIDSSPILCRIDHGSKIIYLLERKITEENRSLFQKLIFQICFIFSQEGNHFLFCLHIFRGLNDKGKSLLVDIFSGNSFHTTSPHLKQKLDPKKKTFFLQVNLVCKSKRRNFMFIVYTLLGLSLVFFVVHLALDKQKRTKGRVIELFLLYQLVFNVGIMSFLAFYGHTGLSDY